MTTYKEFVGEGYWVDIVYCDNPDCDEFLGVNYPSNYCSKECRDVVAAIYAEHD